MAERSGFFNAYQLENGEYDRKYDAANFAELFAMFIGNGVYASPANQLQVQAQGGTKVTVKKGKAFIDGYYYILDEDKTLEFSLNATGTNRLNTISCILNLSTRTIKVDKKENVSSVLPVNSEGVHELTLCSFTMPSGLTEITDAMLVDRRPDRQYCGFVFNLLGDIDTTGLFRQYNDAFTQWFSTVQNTLGEDTAGNILNMIGDLSDLETADKDNLVDAINYALTADTTVYPSSMVQQGQFADAKGYYDYIGNIANLSTQNKSSVVSSINNIMAMIGNMGDLQTTSTSSLVSALNSAVKNVIPVNIFSSSVNAPGSSADAYYTKLALKDLFWITSSDFSATSNSGRYAVKTYPVLIESTVNDSTPAYRLICTTIRDKSSGEPSYTSAPGIASTFCTKRYRKYVQIGDQYNVLREWEAAYIDFGKKTESGETHIIFDGEIIRFYVRDDLNIVKNYRDV